MKQKVIELTVSELREIFADEIQKSNSIPTQNSKWLSRLEACNKLNISYPTLHNYVNKGMLIPHKVGHKTFFLNSDVEKLIEDGRMA